MDYGVPETPRQTTAASDQRRMSDLPSDDPPALQQSRPAPSVRARVGELARLVRRLALRRTLCRQDQVPRVRHAGEVRPSPERKSALQTAEVACGGWTAEDGRQRTDGKCDGRIGTKNTVWSRPSSVLRPQSSVLCPPP